MAALPPNPDPGKKPLVEHVIASAAIAVSLIPISAVTHYFIEPSPSRNALEVGEICVGLAVMAVTGTFCLSDYINEKVLQYRERKASMIEARMRLKRLITENKATDHEIVQIVAADPALAKKLKKILLIQEKAETSRLRQRLEEIDAANGGNLQKSADVKPALEEGQS
jgi:hypothetical protein